MNRSPEERLPPESAKADLQMRYNNIIQGYIQPLFPHIPTEVLLGNINVAIQNIFGWDITNRVALYSRVAMQDPQRRLHEMRVIKDIYDRHFKKYKPTSTRYGILQFEEMFEKVYKPAWEEKQIMPETPEKITPGGRQGGKRGLKV